MAATSALWKYPPPTASQRFSHENALEAFNVPFVYMSGDGSSVYASAAAEALLRSDAAGASLATQVRQAGKELCWSHGHTRLPVGHLQLVREVPCCTDDGKVLALHLAVSSTGQFGVVIVIRPSAAAGPVRLPALGLTQREAEVARLIAGGLATKAIAALLGISIHTVRHHSERVFEKLGVHTRSSVAAVLSGHWSDDATIQVTETPAALTEGAISVRPAKVSARQCWCQPPIETSRSRSAAAKTRHLAAFSISASDYLGRRQSRGRS
jgi:DNA-binding CsgD family transcriptional regulator